ncbi:hypothetical protein PG988_002278 [Apiospora saccharicola]
MHIPSPSLPDRRICEHVLDVVRFVGRIGQESSVQLVAKGLFPEGRKQTMDLVVVAESVEEGGLLDTLMVVHEGSVGHSSDHDTLDVLVLVGEEFQDLLNRAVVRKLQYLVELGLVVGLLERLYEVADRAERGSALGDTNETLDNGVGCQARTVDTYDQKVQRFVELVGGTSLQVQQRLGSEPHRIVLVDQVADHHVQGHDGNSGPAPGPEVFGPSGALRFLPRTGAPCSPSTLLLLLGVGIDVGQSAADVGLDVGAERLVQLEVFILDGLQEHQVLLFEISDLLTHLVEAILGVLDHLLGGGGGHGGCKGV